MTSRPSSRSANSSVGNFHVDSEIGKGSFAQVYSGRHKETGQLVAIKSVEMARLSGKKLRDSLFTEINILKSLRHPHIVALHDCLQYPTHIHLIMEFCELGDLALFIKKRDKLITHPATHDLARKYPSPPNSGLHEVIIRHFLQQLASALKFLREKNYVHRDVKPQNLLLLPSAQFRGANNQIYAAGHESLRPVAGLASLPMLKLADFGFARALPSTSLAETLCGSPLYMAPEILRYEKYDAKADLWSVGTVLYEMISGRPPFRAQNYVELLRRIEAAKDVIRFPRDVHVTPELRALTRAILRRNAVGRLSFDNFFSHPIIAGPIPGLVEDDVPSPPLPPPTSPSATQPRRRDSLPTDATVGHARIQARSEEQPSTSMSSSRRHSLLSRRFASDPDGGGGPIDPPLSLSPSSKPRKSSPLATPIDVKPNPLDRGAASRQASPRNVADSGADSPRLPQRPPMQPSTLAPARPVIPGSDRRSRTLRNISSRERVPADDGDQAAQDIAFERDYVVIEKRQVEVNAFADQMMAADARPAIVSPRSAGKIIRRATQQGNPTSATGAVPPMPSRAVTIAQGREHTRRASYDNKSFTGSSPASATSLISKAIQDASFRLLGVKYSPHLFSKGPSPPAHPYSPFPAYPLPAATPPVLGLVADAKPGGTPVDEDARAAQCIEEYATRSDVVYGFAEVKFKQLIPLMPSTDHDLLGGGGLRTEDKFASMSTGNGEDGGLTAEAVVTLSEEALVLYVKALSLLAKSMDIAGLWWSRRSRVDARDVAHGRYNLEKVNSVVQWIRSRFNEVLEKAELMRLKLADAQKQLPDHHPSHPSNRAYEPNGAHVDGVVLSAGLSAEKLIYDSALEMSRTAAINEISNEDLVGCERSYVTAIRMLEAVLDTDDDVTRRKPFSTENLPRADTSLEISLEDQQAVKKIIQMITAKLAALRKKIKSIQTAMQAQNMQSASDRRRSIDVTPRSVPSNASLS